MLAKFACRQKYWYECPLSFKDIKVIPFKFEDKEYVIEMIRIKDGSDTQKMWGGYPSSVKQYVAVSILCDGHKYPLSGASRNLLNIHSIKEINGRIVMKGSDGGLSWVAYGNIKKKSDGVILNLHSIEDMKTGYYRGVYYYSF